AARALEPIGRECTDAAVAVLALAGDCRGAATVGDAVACLRGTHEAEAETLSAVIDAVPAALSPVAQTCRRETSREVRRVLAVRQRSIQKCKRTPERYLLDAGRACDTSPRIVPVLEKAETRAFGRIALTCGAGALGETRFGAPCDVVATGTELAGCILSAAVRAAGGALEAEYADTGFCGDTGDAVDARIDELIPQMTLAEKIAQMHGSGLSGNAWRTAGVPALGIPGLGMLDGPRGVSAAAGNGTAFPVGMARGATWDPALEARVGAAMGEEVRAKTASVLLAPTINILRHPRWGRAQETYGEDTFHLGRMASGFVGGVQEHIIANPKHFAANSIENTRFNVDVTVDERSLREIYTRHFQEAVQRGRAASVMSAYNKVNGFYCGENHHLLTDLLKDEWGFQGFVESDWVLGTRSTIPSIMAGLDIEMPTGVKYGTPLLNAVNNAQVPEALLDAAVRRIVRTQFCFRLDTEPPVANPALVESPEHLDLALEVAQKGIVLLKNAAAALPLDRTQIASLVVVGPLATVANLGDSGSSSVAPTTTVSPLDGITARAGSVTVTHVPGPTFSAGEQATIAAADAAVVVAGLTANDEGESIVGAGDRVSLVLPLNQDQLVADVAVLNARTVVLLEGSGPVTMPWLPDVEAVLIAWYPGQQGGYAIGDVLFGDVNPSGKLPLSFPVAEADLPPFDNTTNAVTYDYYHGYRWLDRNATAPLFPFGFGLSYASFQYANLVVAPATISPWGRVHVSVDVTNAGTVAGDEVVQLYVSYPGSAVDRAVHDLKGFARVHLEPGETRTVPLELRAADLAYWDVGADDWAVEALAYGVAVGSSSGDLPLTGSFTVTP
ncbi:MAG TPA: glycoside hydrolase family 3 C-terminal domain-containing protein, partial [Candidatus Binatia bacterium]|nr:glycoside hydrolase family 3 C-terminal domain-containing protein [Candidatus Binatia bacterium]